MEDGARSPETRPMLQAPASAKSPGQGAAVRKARILQRPSVGVRTRQSAGVRTDGQPGERAARRSTCTHVEERSAALSDVVPIFAVAAVITPTAAVRDRMLSSTSRTMRAYFASPLAPAWYDCGGGAAAAPAPGAPAHAPSRARLSLRDAISWSRGCNCGRRSSSSGHSKFASTSAASRGSAFAQFGAEFHDSAQG